MVIVTIIAVLINRPPECTAANTQRLILQGDIGMCIKMSTRAVGIDAGFQAAYMYTATQFKTLKLWSMELKYLQLLASVSYNSIELKYLQLLASVSYNSIELKYLQLLVSVSYNSIELK